MSLKLRRTVAAMRLRDGGDETERPRWPRREPRASLAAAALTIAVGFATGPIAAAVPDDTCTGPGLGTCLHSDQMRELAGSGEQMVTGYLNQIGIPGESSPNSVPRLIYIPTGDSVGSACVDVNGYDTQHDRSFDYCLADNTVYVGQNTLWDSYRQFGAAGPISGLAHEYGHFLQAVMGVPNPRSASETIRNEDQADCFSGAFIGYLPDRGEAEQPDDVDSVERYLTATASVEAPGRDHGTAQERIDSFETGYRGALPACNRFYPETPLSG